MVARPLFSKLGAELFRDYNTIGDPGSGVFNPVKSDIRAYLLATEGFLGDLYDKAPTTLGSVGGSANAITATGTPTVDALAAGQIFIFTPTSTNTAAGPTLNIDALGALTLADSDGVDLPIGGLIASRAHMLFHDGTKLRVIGVSPSLYKVLDTDDSAGSNVNTAQAWFATAGGITLPVGSWFMEAFLWLSRSTGASSHTTSFLFAGTATYTIDWMALVNTGDAVALATPALVAAAVATATQIKAASTSTTEQIIARVTARIKVTGAGTFIPQFQYSVAPGGAPTAKRGSFIRLIPRDGNLSAVGAWA